MSARLWLALAAGAGCAVCAYAGLYPQFDEGRLRLVLALTSAPFAAAVVASALSARSAEGALGRAVLYSSILGVATVVLPAAMLSRHGSGEFIAACIFGAILGAPTGALYGLVLGALAATGFRSVRAATSEATDRAARLAGIWVIGLSLLGTAAALALEQPKWDWATETMVAQSPLPWLVAIAGAPCGLVVVLWATLRMRRRVAWLERVRAGLEATFRLRPIDARDSIDGLPRISNGDGVEVVEWCPDELGGAASGAAYRAAAFGTAVAVVNAAPLQA